MIVVTIMVVEAAGGLLSFFFFSAVVDVEITDLATMDVVAVMNVEIMDLIVGGLSSSFYSAVAVTDSRL